MHQENLFTLLQCSYYFPLWWTWYKCSNNPSGPTFAFVMWGGQYGYIIVSKFGLHQVATHSPTWNFEFYKLLKSIILMKIHFRKWIHEIKDEGKQHTCQFGWSELAASLLESFLFSPSTSGKKKLSAWTWFGTNLYYNSITQRSYTNFLRHLGLFWYNPVVSILVILDLK